MNDERLLTNRRNWNERTPVHAATEFYDVEGFKAGRITLTDVERREVGDVDGKTLLHLQCHFGLDTMSWARLGAKATGVDFSDAAIDLARSLNDELELNTRFIRSDMYDLPDVLDEEFDIVDAVEVSESGALHATYGYFHREVSIQGNEPSYAGAQPIESPAYEWQHTLGDVVTALIEAGLRIEFLHEFPFCSQERSGMERCGNGRWRFPNRGESFPHRYSIRATK